jgi:hypothetical protein
VLAGELLYEAITEAPLPLALSGGTVEVVNTITSGVLVNATPEVDEDFSSAGSAISPAAHEKVDLLTAMLHEFGHLLGLDDLVFDGSDTLMTGTLGVGSRRLPTPELIDALFADDSND